MAPAQQLEGKVAVITGAASGMGFAIALLFAQEGARVVAADVAAEGLSRLEGQPGVETVVADVTRQDDVDRMIGTAVERHGGVDILCNVAGIMDRFLQVAETTDDVWARVLAVNLTGPFLTSRCAIPIMLKAGSGAIVNISSLGGLLGGRAGAAYTASKHGLIGLTKNIAASYGLSGIRCVAICPGGVRTGIGYGGEPSELGVAMMRRSSGSMVRVAEPNEIANVVLFAVSNAASYVNGAVLVADGGWTAH